MDFRRGDVLWVDFDPATGTEVRKVRPAIVVSNDAAIYAIARMVVVPTTSNTKKCYPSEAHVTINGRVSKAMIDQIQTASLKRVHGWLGRVDAPDMESVEKVILSYLGLSKYLNRAQEKS